jgi:hypothetical protein
VSRRRERPIPPVRDWHLVPPIVTTEELMAILANGRSNLDELLAAGLPHLNLGTGEKRKMLRFEPDAVISWLRTRNGNSR